MTQATRYLLANQRRRNPSGDGPPMTDQERWMSSTSARLRRGSAPELGNVLLPPIDDAKTNRSSSPRRWSRSPVMNNSIIEKKDSNVEGRLFTKHSLKTSSTSLSRHSSNQSVNNSLVAKTGSLSIGRNYRSNSLTGLSNVPPELLKPRNKGNQDLKPLEKNARFRRRLSDTPIPRRNVSDNTSANKLYGLNKSNNTKSKVSNNCQEIKNDRHLTARPPSTSKSDSNLTCETVREIDNSSDSCEDNHDNNNRIIEWLIGVESSLLTDTTEKDVNGDELENIKETAIKIVYEETEP